MTEPSTCCGERPLHVLGMDLAPLNGYVVRTLSILEAQRRAGWEPLAVTPPFYPRRGSEAPALPAGCDVELFRVEHPSDEPQTAQLDAADRLCRALYGLRRLRPPPRAGSGTPGTPAGAARLPPRLLALARPMLTFEERLLMRRLERKLLIAAPLCRADLLHVHSPYRSALPAIAAARRLALPLVYEVRGLWEESGVATGHFTRGSATYRRWRRLEEQARRRADAVIVLSQELRREVIGRGAPAERVFVVPNGVDATWLVPPGEHPVPAEAERCRQRLASLFTFGFVGTLRSLEGVDGLLCAVALLRRESLPVGLLIVGEGPERPALQRLAGELGLGEHAVFTGAVPHHEVKSWYRLLQAFVVPRPDLPVTRLVAPLKPLEAMAQGLPVIASDLPALRETVEHGRRGLLYAAGDVAALAAACRSLVEDPRLAATMGRRGRRWVEAERSWERLLATQRRAYAMACEVQRSRARTVTGG